MKGKDEVGQLDEGAWTLPVRYWTRRAGRRWWKKLRQSPADVTYWPHSFYGFPLHFVGNYYVRCTRVMSQLFTTTTFSRAVIKLPLMRKVEYLINIFKISYATRLCEEFDDDQPRLWLSFLSKLQYLYLTVENIAPRILQRVARYFKISFLENCRKELQLIPIANTNCMQDSRLDEIMMETLDFPLILISLPFISFIFC